MESFYGLLILLLVVTSIWVTFSYTQGKTQFGEWAKSKGLTVLKCERRTLLRGPYTMSASKHQSVFRFEVKDENEKLRAGWASCGSFWRGAPHGEVTVIWDDETQQ